VSGTLISYQSNLGSIHTECAFKKADLKTRIVLHKSPSFSICKKGPQSAGACYNRNIIPSTLTTEKSFDVVIGTLINPIIETLIYV